MKYYLRHMSTTTDEETLNREQVAALFKVHVVTVSKWAQRGILPSFMTPSGIYRFYRSDVEAFMQRNTKVRPTQ